MARHEEGARAPFFASSVGPSFAVDQSLHSIRLYPLRAFGSPGSTFCFCPPVRPCSMWTDPHSDSRGDLSTAEGIWGIRENPTILGETVSTVSSPFHAARELSHLHRTAHDQRRALVDAFGLNIEDALCAVACAASCLLGQKS